MGGSLGAGEAEAGVSPNRLVLSFNGPPFSVKSPSGPGKITGGSRVWPTHGPWDPLAVARTLLISGYRLGLTAPGSRPRLPGLRIACKMRRLATDQPASSWLVRASFRRPLTDMGCTCGGPFMYLTQPGLAGCQTQLCRSRSEHCRGSWSGWCASLDQSRTAQDARVVPLHKSVVGNLKDPALTTQVLPLRQPCW